MKWALAALVLSAAARAEAPSHAPYVAALVVGYNQSNDPAVPNLRYADDDAARYAELFQGVADKVVLLTVLDAESQERHQAAAATARPPTRRALDEAVASIAESVKAAAKEGRRTELFFVYAGHGTLTPEHEGSVNLVDGVLRRRDLFHEVLGPVPADFKHVIIDACDAYFMVAKRGAASPKDVQAMKELLDSEALEGHPEVGALISGSREVETHEWSGLESGVFSHEIRSALLGAADADGDGVLRYSEIAAFVSAANEGLSDPRAKVEVFARPPQVDLSHPVIDLRRGPRRFLEVPATMKGLVEVEDARGARYADVNASGEKPVYLRLIGDQEYFVFRDGREARIPSALKGILAVIESAFGPPRRLSRGAIEDDLRHGLFSVPFGPGFFRGFVAHDPALGGMPHVTQTFPELTDLRTEVTSLPPGTLVRRAGWVSIGAGVLLGAASAVAAVEARSEYDTFLRRLGSQGTFDPNQVSRVSNWQLATNVMLGAAVTAGAVGVLLLFLSDSSSGPALGSNGVTSWFQFDPERGLVVGF